MKRHKTCLVSRATRSLPIWSLAFLVFTALPISADESADFSGHWKLVPHLSDDPSEVLKEKARGERKERGRRVRSLRRGRSEETKARLREIQESLKALDSIAITHDDPLLVLTDAEGQRYTIYTDGRAVERSRGDRTASGEWRNGSLVIERQGERGRAEETFRLMDGHLVMTTTLSGRRLDEVNLKRTYQRIESPPTDDG